MRFELRHDIFFMHSCEESVTGQYIDPVLLRSGQYLQSVLLQKLNPLSLFEVPALSGAILGVDGAGCGATTTAGCPLKSTFLALLKKSVIRLCFGFTDVGGGLMAATGGVGITIWLGSASSSPGAGGILARTRRSRRFLGLL